VTLAAIPSPTTAVWQLGPIPIRAYALFIVAGIVVASVITEYRLRARGAPPWAVLDLAVWAIPFGIVGARLYHVISSPQGYFGADGDLLDILRIWEGGLAIWGAIAGGAVGVWLCCRYQLKLPFLLVADAAAVGLPLAQAVGRLGNWFNNELYGTPTTLPWALEVHRMEGGRAALLDGEPVVLGTHHPTFLYEILWNIGVAILVWQVGKHLRLGRGRQFALYVAAYTAGRFWIEMLRDDPATEIFGARINVWVSVLVFLGAAAYLWLVRGPQEYLVPLPEGSGYRVVTEAEFRAAQDAEDAGPTEAGLADSGSADASLDAGSGDAGSEDAGPAGDGGGGVPVNRAAQRSQAASGDDA
jgi:prolipoprotein diacylglyceryl transferase